MKRIAGAGAVRGGIGQRSDDFRELEKRPGPAVRHGERHGVGLLRSLVDEMNVEPVDVGLELIQLVEPPLLGAPIEFLAPVSDELFEVPEIGAVVPIRSWNLV